MTPTKEKCSWGEGCLHESIATVRLGGQDRRICGLHLGTALDVEPGARFTVDPLPPQGVEAK